MDAEEHRLCGIVARWDDHAGDALVYSCAQNHLEESRIEAFAFGIRQVSEFVTAELIGREAGTARAKGAKVKAAGTHAGGVGPEGGNGGAAEEDGVRKRVVAEKEVLGGVDAAGFKVHDLVNPCLRVSVAQGIIGRAEGVAAGEPCHGVGEGKVGHGRQECATGKMTWSARICNG